MPTLTIEGRKVTVGDEFLKMSPEEQNATVDEIAQSFSAEQPNVVADVLKSGASGAARGTADLVGTPGLFGAGAAAGGISEFGERRGMQDWRPDWLAGAEDTVKSAVTGIADYIPSGEDIRGGLSWLTGGATEYQPQTTAGEYARTAGEFLPAAAIPVPGVGALSRAGRFAVAPALTSEAAGQATEGTRFETAARVGGALAGGVAGGFRAGGQAAQIPTAAEIKAGAGYEALKEPMKAARVGNERYREALLDMRDELSDFGVVPEKHGAVLSVIRRHAKLASEGADPSLYDMELLRRSLRNAGADPTNPSAGTLSGKLIDKLDDFVDDLDVDVLPALKDARKIYRTGIKSEVIETAIEKAENARGGFESGLRTEFKGILNNPRKARQFSEAEKKVMKKVVRGEMLADIFRFTGSGKALLGGLTAPGYGAIAGGPVGAAIGGLLTAGQAAGRFGANQLARRNAATAHAMAGGPQATQALTGARSTATAGRVGTGIRGGLQAQQASDNRLVNALIQNQAVNPENIQYRRTAQALMNR